MFKKHLLTPTHRLVVVAKLTMLPTKLSELPFVGGWQESEGLSLEQTTQVQVPALHLPAGGPFCAFICSSVKWGRGIHGFHELGC